MPFLITISYRYILYYYASTIQPVEAVNVYSKQNKKITLKAQNFYKRSAWRRVRLLVLQRDGYICRLKYSGCTRIATEVHHIQPLEDAPDLGLDPDNLIAVCWSCHEQTKQHKADSIALSTAKQAGVRVIEIH